MSRAGNNRSTSSKWNILSTTTCLSMRQLLFHKYLIPGALIGATPGRKWRLVFRCPVPGQLPHDLISPFSPNQAEHVYCALWICQFGAIETRKCCKICKRQRTILFSCSSGDPMKHESKGLGVRTSTPRLYLCMSDWALWAISSTVEQWLTVQGPASLLWGLDSKKKRG